MEKNPLINIKPKFKTKVIKDEDYTTSNSQIFLLPDKSINVKLWV